jgi:putative transposase
MCRNRRQLSSLKLSAELEEVDPGSVLDDLVREGARRMLQAAIEGEVADYIDRHQTVNDDQGRRMVIRNGHLPERDLIQRAAGPL